MTRLFVRVLNKLNLLPRLSVVTKVRLSQSVFRIPVVNGIGLANIVPKADWLSDLLKRMQFDERFVFIDVGANIGQTVLQVKALRPHIRYIAFEPNSVCVFYLNQLIALNGFENITIVPIGLGNEPSLQTLNKMSATDSGASVVDSGRRNLREVVPVLSLDSIYSKFDVLSHKVIMKIDVEGYELEALTGMKQFLRMARPTIIIEILDALKKDDLKKKRERNSAVLNLLSSSGYRAYRLLKNASATTVQTLEAISEITTVVMNRERYNLHDYLFVPNEAEPPIFRQS